jgi:hypothetical protein
MHIAEFPFASKFAPFFDLGVLLISFLIFLSKTPPVPSSSVKYQIIKFHCAGWTILNGGELQALSRVALTNALNSNTEQQLL